MSPAAENSLTIGVAAGAVRRRGRPRRQYRCQHCARTFKRSEHCIRHERTHTQEKPFACRYCHKSYSRKDQVTRHERTLHADAQEQREQQEQQEQQQQQRNPSQEYIVADQVNVAWAPTSVKSKPLETPPSDIEEPQADENRVGQGELASGSAPRSLPSPRDEAGFSPYSSPTTSPSSATSVTSDRCPSRFFATDGAIQSDSMIVAMPNQPSSHQRKTSLTTANTSTDSQSQLDTTHGYYDPSGAPLDFAASYPTARGHDAEPADPDLVPSTMTLDDAIQLAQPENGSDPSHRPQDQHVQQGQEPAPFFFSPAPDVDLGLAGFTFSPLMSHDIDLSHDHNNPHLTENFRLQPLPMGGFEGMPDFSHPAVPDFNTAENFSAQLNSPLPRDACDLPLLLRDVRPARPVLTLDDTAYMSLRCDLMQRLLLSDMEINIPPANICQAFLSSYVANFHGHLPIIHLQTLHLKATPSPLLLAMSSIGALYRLDRRRARQLYNTATRSLETTAIPSQDDGKSLVKDYALWYVQARFLLSFYAIMSGDKDLVLGTMTENGFYTLVFNGARTALGSDKTGLSRMTWHDWIERESWKRLLGGLLVASTLTMVIFDVNPGFNGSQDLEFEAFHDEALWDAESPNEWRELRTDVLKQQQTDGRRTLRQVSVDIMLEGRYHSEGTPYHVSAFNALVLMHAMVVLMWQRLQVSQALAEPGGDSFSVSRDDQLGRSLLDNAMKSLVRCDAFLRSAELDMPQGNATDETRESSLVFNCQAVLRIAYIRLFKPASPTGRINLISQDPMEMEASATSFVMAGLNRSSQLLDAVTKSLEGLIIPVKLGHLLVRKTAAFRWSVEHAIAGWESALLVTKWVHSVEIATLNGEQPSPRERDLLSLIEEVLQEAEYDLNESVSLAAGVAATWGWLLQDVWIWGITPRMGAALGVLAKAYERTFKANRRHPSHTGP